MKKLLLAFTFIFTTYQGLQAQCSATTAPAFMNCNYYGDVISAFSLGGVPSVGNAGCSPGGYSLFTTPVRTLTIGQTFSWTASTGSYYANGFGMWIDWNNDGQYVTSENVAARNYAYNHSGTLTVPFNAVTGVNLRMRIRCALYYTFLNTTSPCNSLYGYGETEDYFVFIACPLTGPPLTVAATNTNICLGQSVTFTASGAQTYNWASTVASVTNGVAFTPSVSGTYTVIGSIPGCPTATTSLVRTVSVSTVPLAVNATASSSNICSGTNATLTASGANNYTWAPGNFTSAVIVVSPSSSSIYTLVGYNGSACPGTSTVSLGVTGQPTLAVAATATNVCSGAAVTLTVSGANSYTWQTVGSNAPQVTVNPTIATAYAVVGSNTAGCTSQTAQVITVKNSPTVTATTSKSLICVGSSATLTAGGASSYAWSNNATTGVTVVSPTISTTYTVVGTGTNACMSTKIVTVNVYQHLMTISQATAICAGKSVNLSASAGGISSYTWSNGANGAGISVSPAVTTTYIATAKTQTNGMSCLSSGAVVVTVNALPVLAASATPASICRREVSTISVTGASTYTWSNIKTDPSFTVAPSSAANFTYSVIGLDNNGCQGTTQVVLLVNNCTGVSEVSNGAANVTVYPNPSKGIFTVHVANVPHNAVYKVYNSLGALVKEQACNSTSVIFDLEKEANGIYFIDLMQDGKKINTSRIIKE